MLGDVVRDPIGGQEYVVIWNGARGGKTLLDYDPRYSQSKGDAKDRQTQGATMTLDVRPRSAFFKQEL